MELLEYAENEDERADLDMAFDPTCPNIDPFDEDRFEMAQIQQRIAAQLRPKQINICRAIMRGLSYQEICDQLKTSRPTIKKTLRNDTCRRYIAASQTIRQLHNGPSEQSRAAMLWRIAKREEERNPRVTIQALDTLNKQMGVYAAHQLKDMEAQDAPIVIRNFTVNVNSPGEPQPAPTVSAPEGGTVIEGEFTPINVPDEPTS